MKQLLTFLFLGISILSYGQPQVKLVGVGQRTGTTPTPPGGGGGGGGSSDNGTFSYTIPAGNWRVSAGVFTPTGTLIRTLFTTQTRTAGTYNAVWDGKDDHAVPVSSPLSSYNIKVRRTQATYTWLGAHVGNTSAAKTGQTRHQNYYTCATDMVFDGSYGYFCNGYSEGRGTTGKFAVSDPQTKLNYYLWNNSNIITMNVQFVCKDAVRVYWAGVDSYSSAYRGGQRNSLVYANRVDNDDEFQFGSAYDTAYRISASTNPATGILLNSAIAFRSDMNVKTGFITGMAVQQSGNYLFVARGGINRLEVYDKVTGQFVRVMTYTGVRGLTIDGTYMWMITGTLPGSCAKYLINSDGTLASASLTITAGSMLNLMDTDISPDGTKIGIIDDSTNQQVKFFNTTTGALLSTLGTAGGYITNPDVNNNKFYFHDNNPNANLEFFPFISFQTDGNYWVNDPGNFRVQKYNSSNSYLNRIMSIGSSYNVYVDPNNPSRCFMGCIEFFVDYGVTLSGSSGWQLVKNWGANVTGAYTRNYILYPTTLSNGRTYCYMALTTNQKEYFELPTSGPMRSTGKFKANNHVFDKDGNQQQVAKGGLGSTSTINRWNLTGFDGSNNPIWDPTAEPLATTPTLTLDDPNDILTGQCISDTVIVWWLPDLEQATGVYYTGSHLGGQKIYDNKWLWKTQYATHRTYVGMFPDPDHFDIGNSVNQFAGGTLSVFGRNLFTSYHGEFWKNSQTNMYNHYWNDGLPLGQFGKVRYQMTEAAGEECAGNALTPIVVADPNNANSAYLYQGDESYHSGVHVWHIQGLNTTAVETIALKYPTVPYVDASGIVDLMKDLPFNSAYVSGTAPRWTLSTPGYLNTPTSTDDYQIRTTLLGYKYPYENDISFDFSSSTVRTNNGYCDLRTGGVANNVSVEWSVNMIYMNKAGLNVNGLFFKQYLDILDDADKVIARLYIDNVTTSGFTKIFGNGVALASFADNITIQNQLKLDEFLDIRANSTIVRFQYAQYPPITTSIFDGTANWRRPTRIRVMQSRTSTSNPVYPQTQSIKNAKYNVETVTTRRIRTRRLTPRNNLRNRESPLWIKLAIIKKAGIQEN